MTVKLLHFTPLKIADISIGKCWNKQKEEVDKERMYRVANKFKHSSTVECINYSFDIDGCSRACLQEISRHRIQSLSVESTRYTLTKLRDRFKGKSFDALGEVKDELYNAVEEFCVIPKDLSFDDEVTFKLAMANSLGNIAECSLSNDKTKYMLIESFKTSLVSTMNMRALQNFLSLRTDKSALWEIQELAHKMFEVLPEEHKFMLEDFVKEKK